MITYLFRSFLISVIAKHKILFNYPSINLSTKNVFPHYFEINFIKNTTIRKFSKIMNELKNK